MVWNIRVFGLFGLEKNKFGNCGRCPDSSMDICILLDPCSYG